MANTSNNVTQEQAIKGLSRAKVISEPGTYKNVRIAWINSIVDTDGNERHIVNLDAIGAKEMNVAKSLFTDGEFADALNMRLTTNLFPNQVSDFAIGQLVDVQVDHVNVTSEKTRELIGNQRLGVIAMLRPKAKEAVTDNFFADMLEGVKGGVKQTAPVEDDFDNE